MSPLGSSGPILHVITDLDVGGAERMLANYLSRQRPQKRPHVVLSLKQPGSMAASIASDGFSVHSAKLPEPGGVNSLGLLLRLPGGLISTAQMIRHIRPSAIVGWMYHANVFAEAALRLSGRRAATRLIAGIRCSAMDPSRYGAVHGLVVGRSRSISGKVDILAYNSETGRREHEAIGFAPEKAAVISNGVDTARFAPDPEARYRVRAELGLDPEMPVFICAARVDPMKNHSGLIEAFETLNGRAALVLVGKDTDTALPRTHNIYGLGIRSDMPELYAAADFVVMGSAFGEGFPNAVAEGMASGLSPIVTNVGDASRILGDVGRVVEPGQPQMLAAALVMALDDGVEKSARDGLLARQRIVDHFSLDRAVAQIDALIDGDLKQG